MVSARGVVHFRLRLRDGGDGVDAVIGKGEADDGVRFSGVVGG